MPTLTRHTTSHLAAQLCSGLTSVATNCDTESGVDYTGPIFKMATLTRHTTNHMAAQPCSGLTSVATNFDTESGVDYIGPFFFKWPPSYKTFLLATCHPSEEVVVDLTKENGRGVQKKRKISFLELKSRPHCRIQLLYSTT